LSIERPLHFHLQLLPPHNTYTLSNRSAVEKLLFDV
jgi:hypothetical protein